MATLRTDYKNDTIKSGEMNRRFRMIQNSDRTVSFEDATLYDIIGDEFGADDINRTNAQINTNAQTLEGCRSDITSLSNKVGDLTGLTTTEKGTIVAALNELKAKDDALNSALADKSLSFMQSILQVNKTINHPSSYGFSKIPMDSSTAIQSGTNLELADGGIKIGQNINAVEIIGDCTVRSGSFNGYLGIMINDGYGLLTVGFSPNGVGDSQAHISRIALVSPGDIISLNIGSVSAGDITVLGTRTTLSVRVVY